jgi:hypothetical protein
LKGKSDLQLLEPDRTTGVTSGLRFHSFPCSVFVFYLLYIHILHLLNEIGGTTAYYLSKKSDLLLMNGSFSKLFKTNFFFTRQSLQVFLLVYVLLVYKTLIGFWLQCREDHLGLVRLHQIPRLEWIELE